MTSCLDVPGSTPRLNWEEDWQIEESILYIEGKERWKKRSDRRGIETAISRLTQLTSKILEWKRNYSKRDTKRIEFYTAIPITSTYILKKKKTQQTWHVSENHPSVSLSLADHWIILLELSCSDILNHSCYVIIVMTSEHSSNEGIEWLYVIRNVHYFSDQYLYVWPMTLIQHLCAAFFHISLSFS